MKPLLCIVVLFVVVAVCLTGLADAKSRTRPQRRRIKPSLISGQVVKEIEDSPWQVGIMHNKRIICGGSLVKKDVVLTAAECIKGVEPANLLVRAGTLDFKKGGQFRKVRETIHHPEYDEGTRANNVALLHLVRPFNSTKYSIRSVKLPKATDELPSSILVYGWGSSFDKNATLTTQLRSSKEKIYSSKKCAQFLNDDSLIESVFCTGDRIKRSNVCNDDLGSPAMDNGIQYGVVSESNACSKKVHTTVYANVIPLKAWIVETLEELKTATPLETVISEKKPKKKRKSGIY